MLITWGLVRLMDLPMSFCWRILSGCSIIFTKFCNDVTWSHSNISNIIRSQWWISFHFKHEIIGTLVTLHYDLPTKQILLK